MEGNSVTKHYKIEHKILTLADCAVMDAGKKPASFEIEGILFSHWDFDYKEGWRGADAWLAEGNVDAQNFVDAINAFRTKLNKLIPRISLIGQSYIEFTREAFVIHDIERDIAFLEYSQDIKAGGLMFMEQERDALVDLLSVDDIPESFYYYWNDAVNVPGYSAKLLLMFSALEAMAKGRNKSIFPKPRDLYRKILGDELEKEVFEETVGLRNRLVHGQHFSSNDSARNYLEIVHKKVIEYFNKEVLSKALLSEDVVSPQRHPFGAKEGGRWIIKRRDGTALFPLRDILSDFDQHGFQEPERYEHVFDTKNEIVRTY